MLILYMLGGKNRKIEGKIMELSLDLSLVHAPQSISEFLKEVWKIKNGFQRLLKISDYVKRLEDEMKKIDAFKRELPLCMLLLKDGIERMKEEERKCKVEDGLVAKELIPPLKRNTEENGRVNMENDGGDKNKLLGSVQLWNSSDSDERSSTVPELKLRIEEEEKKLSENTIELCSNEKTFMGMVDKENLGLSLMIPSSELVSHSSILKSSGSCRIGFGSSLYSDQNQIKFQTKQQHEFRQQRIENSRKQRRCWSPDLHRRFVDALQKLGGSKVATPKQIKELMQVDGLTNDEVKSHLQKYRLHIRKLPASSAGKRNSLESVQNQCNNKHMKANISESGSPQGPFFAGGCAKGLSSTTEGDSMDAEDDEKSDGRI